MSARWPLGRVRMPYRRSSTPATKRRRARNCGCGRSISSRRLRCRTCCTDTSAQYGELHNLADKCAIQLNDTHPAIVVAELMRLLVDEHRLPWAEAWQITTNTISYTNHTLLPEALESWPVSLMERLLPRHMQIIYEINKLHLDALAAQPDMPPLSSVSLIDEHGERRVRMGTLAFIGSHKVNGVSALHTELMRAHRVPVTPPALSGPDRQQDQRHHLPPLAAHRQSSADRLAVRCDRTGGPGRSDDTGAARATGGRCCAARAADRRSARQQDGALPHWWRTGWGSASTRTRWSMCTSSASTNTSGSC